VPLSLRRADYRWLRAESTLSRPHCCSHIVAAEGSGVCDGTHWSFVMNKESSGWPLIPENVLDLRIQIMRSLIDEFEIASVYLSPLHSRF